MSHRRRPEFSESWISAKNTFLHDSDMVHNSIIKFLSHSSGYVDSDKPGLKLRKFWKNVRQWWYHSLVDYLVQSKRKFCRSEKKNIRFITIYPKYFDGNTYIHTCVCAYVHTYVHTHTHTYIYIYIYIYTYVRFILACGSFNAKFTSKTQNYCQMYWSRQFVGRWS